MILSALSVVVAGILEIYRKQNLSETGGFEQKLSDDTFNSSTLSVFLQVPEFALVGASEVFTSISGTMINVIESMPGIVTSLNQVYVHFRFQYNLISMALCKD